MVLKQIQQLNVPTIKWIGAHDPQLSVTHLQHKNLFFYAKCIIGPVTLSVGDFVLVSNADASDPDSIEGCDVAKILNLYELRDMSNRDPYRAIVQWYSRPECIPHKHFDNDEICIDFSTELIEDHRPFDSDISLETIFRKCIVIFGSIETSAAGLLEKFSAKTKSCIMFVCRYKFVKVKNSYRLEPLQFSTEDVASGRGRRKSTTEKIGLETNFSLKKPRRSSVCKSEESLTSRQSGSLSGVKSMEFVDLSYFNSENKVSPIKIIGGRSVVRLSTNKKIISNSIPREDNDSNYLSPSPIDEQNIKVIPQSKAEAAKRNLNLSLDNTDAADSDCLNYSIVRGTSDHQQPLNDMKIKLRLSERRRSLALHSLDEDPLALQHQKKDYIIHSDGRKSASMDTTPKKESTESTPLNRRKSILKSAITRVAEGTPKRRSIQLSSVVEKHIFEDEEIITTPKRTRARKTLASTINAEVDREKSTYSGQPTPRKYQQRTPTKYLIVTKSSNMETHNTRLSSEKVKLIRSGEIKPMLEERNISTDDKNKSDLQVARERLHVSIVPKSLPCREKEFENIYTFLESKIQDQCGGCMYISGVPGTGKSATVAGVIRSLQQRVSKDHLPPFDFLEINGMRLTEPRQAYVHIYRQLTGKTLSWEHAHALLAKRFTTSAPRRVTTVLLVDELDILCNRRQDVVYNLLDWPTKSAARLVVVTIANTMDLPERLLMGRVTSRLGLTRLTFMPYTHKQLQEIVTERLSGSEAFKSDAIQLVARSVCYMNNKEKYQSATRLLMGRVTSRLGLTRLTFMPYTHKQLQEIVTERLSGSEAFKSDAIQLVARKVAAVSGDARRALDICRRATEIADSDGTKTGPDNVKCVNMIHVQQALAEMIASAKVQAIKNCSRLEQIFLQAVVAEVNRTGVEETSFFGVYSQIETISAFMGALTPTPGRALRICSKLGAERLLICEHSRNDIYQKILLNVSMDDIHYALKVNNN